MQLDEYSAVKSLQLDVPRNERERTRLLNLRSDARENVIRFAASEEDARNIIVMLGLGDDDELLNMAVAEPVPSDASPVEIVLTYTASREPRDWGYRGHRHLFEREAA